MELLRWSDKYSVNVQEIDSQHHKLIDLINELYTAMMEKKTKEALLGILDGLVKYTIYHFQTEERYFVEFDYPDTNEHVKEHQEFVKKVSDFTVSYTAGKATISMEILAFLREWVVKHILGSDKRYSLLFNEKGLK
jgi:hemerythrin